MLLRKIIKGDVKQSAEIRVTAVSFLVGFAIGRSIGTVLGGATTPILKMPHKVINDWVERQNERIVNICHCCSNKYILGIILLISSLKFFHAEHPYL